MSSKTIADAATGACITGYFAGNVKRDIPE